MDSPASPGRSKSEPSHSGAFITAKNTLMSLRVRFQTAPITFTIASILLLGLMILAFASFTVSVGVGLRGRPFRLDEKTTNFLVVGDWGISEDDIDRVLDVPHRREVSTSMAKWAKLINAEMVISTGDHVYPHGVADDEDPRFERIFRSFAKGGLEKLDWVPTMGNHDCEGNPDAFLDLGRSTIDPFIFEQSEGRSHWRLADTPGYFSIDKAVGVGEDADVIRIIVLNSCSLVCSGPSRNYRCDPSPNAQGELVGGLPHFADEVWEEDRTEQLAWVKQALAKPKPSGMKGKMWKVVVSHWPVFSFKGNGPAKALYDDLLPLMVQHRVHAYFNGHDHSLQHIRYTPNNAEIMKSENEESQAIPNNIDTISAGPAFFVCGAGGYHIHPKLSPNAEKGINDHAMLMHSDDQHGFMSVSASSDSDVLDVAFVSGKTAKALYKTQVKWY